MSGHRGKGWPGVLGLLILTLIAGACVRNEFSVSFDVDPMAEPTLTLTYYASDPEKGWVVDRALTISGGKGEVKCVTRNPALVYIWERHGRWPLAVAYAKRGDALKVKGRGQDPLEWSIKGNDITVALSDWRLANKDAIRTAMRGQGAEALNKAVGTYVSAHPQDPVSTLLLLVYFDRASDESGFRSLWSKLSGAARGEEWQRLVSRADTGGEAMALLGSEDKLPEEIVLTTLSAPRDTLRLHTAPVLLYFTRMRMDGYDLGIRRLRALTAEAGDSASRLIAEISMEPDSTARRMPLRTDSLRKVVRGWTPLGPSDPEVIRLAAGGVPYAVVAQKGGRVVYRGPDLERAIEKYKEILSQEK